MKNEIIKNKVLIVGGNFHNKGAELMVRTAISIIKALNTSCEPVIIDSFPDTERNTKKTNFKIINLPYYLNLTYVLLHGVNLNAFLIYKVIRCFLGSVCRKNILSDIRHYKELHALKKKVCLVIDISGYGFKTANQREDMFNYIQIFFTVLSKKFEFPYIYFPQSFGSFAKENSFFAKKLKKDIIVALDCSSQLFCRESKSLHNIREYTDFTNGILWADIVLLYPYKKNTFCDARI